MRNAKTDFKAERVVELMKVPTLFPQQYDFTPPRFQQPVPSVLREGVVVYPVE